MLYGALTSYGATSTIRALEKIFEQVDGRKKGALSVEKSESGTFSLALATLTFRSARIMDS